MAFFSVSNLCTPAVVYFWISLVVLVISVISGLHLVANLVQLIFILVWSWILNYLCTKGFTAVSWLLVILPILMGGMVLRLSIGFG